MIRPVPVRAVVFDLDGTLVDSLPLVLAAITHALEPFGRRPTMEIFAHLGGPPRRFMAGLLDKPENLPVALERMAAYHQENFHLIKPFAGASALLEHLQATDVAVGLWTGRDRATTDRLLREHRLDGYFGTVLCGDDLPSHKPDPAGLREIIRRLDRSPGEALLVGDADVDVSGGAACGVDTVLIRHGRTVGAEIVAKSWQTVGSPAEAYALVASCLAGPPGR